MKASELVEFLRKGPIAYMSDSGPVYSGGSLETQQAADRIESQAKAIEEMRGVIKQCHSALVTVTRPDAIVSTTVKTAWAECVAAETAARELLSKEGEQG